MNSAMIETEHLSFTYSGGTTPALSDVCLSIETGEILGIIGPSGAGKTTLAQALSGAIPHHFTGELYGAVRIEGRDTCEVNLSDISRVVGSVLQDIDAQMVAATVEDELLFGLENFGVAHGEIEQRLTDTLERVGIPDLRDREIATLSGGQEQKVAIAAILALQPRVLILDEPTAALDPASSQMIFSILAAIKQRSDITIVVIEQKVALLSTFCDRIAVMDKGRIALVGTPCEVFSHVDELRSIGVDCPRVTRISNSLRGAGLGADVAPWLRVDEAHEALANLLGNHTGAAPDAPDAASSPSSAPVAGADAAPSTSGASPVLDVSQASFSYPGSTTGVTDLSLQAHPGEILGIVGQNGAGKTTLTKLIIGLLKPQTGQIRIAGLNTREHRTSQIARHVSTLFQNPDRQICQQTVLDEVAFNLLLQGVDQTEAHTRARAVAEHFGLPVEAAPFALSRGQRQMVALASVVVTEPDVVVLDEPTCGLDYRECMTVMTTVRELAAQGSAIIMVCHDMEVVSDFADRIAVMNDGRILATGPTHELMRDRALMDQASVEAPQMIQLAQTLAQTVDPRFAELTEVGEIVTLVKELM